MVRNSSLRRKKSRLRKKNLVSCGPQKRGELARAGSKPARRSEAIRIISRFFLSLSLEIQGRKSESSSEGANAANQSAGSDGSSSNQQRSSARKVSGGRTIRTISRDCHGRLTTLVKSGSFSGCTAHQQLSAERTIVSDPTPPFRLSCCTSVASTSETECEEQRNCTRGRFPYEDGLLDTVLSTKELCNQQLNVDSDVEMNSLGNNSFSEQAWDNYQVRWCFQM